MRLCETSTVPPGGWKFTDPNTGSLITAGDYQELVKKAEKLGLTDQVIHDQVCLKNPKWCSADGKPVSVTVSLGEAWNGSKTIARWLDDGRKVSQEEAERRAAICANCFLNVDLVGCTLCQLAVSEAKKYLDLVATTQDGKLKTCAICKCFNRLQIHTPLDLLHESVDEETNRQFPPHCWKRKQLFVV